MPFILLLSLTLGLPQGRVVANDVLPKKERQLLLIRELALGPANLPESLWFPGFNVVVDAGADGRMYITDTGNNRVLIFDRAGKFLRQLGREGEGPGEFVALRRFTVLDGKGAIAFDCMQHLSRLNWFDPELVYRTRRERSSNSFRLKDWRCGPSGKVFACELVRIDLPTRTIQTHFVLTDADMQEQAAVGGHTQEEFDTSRVTQQGYWVQYLAGFYARKQQGQNGYFAFDAQNRVYSAQGNSYEIKRWSPECKLEMVVTRKYHPIILDDRTREAMIDDEHERVTSEIPPELHSVVTRAVVARAFSLADLPPIKPPVVGLVAMEHGFIAIHSHDLSRRRSQGDVFNEAGEYVGTYSHETWGMRNMVFKNGKAYTIERNGDGDNQLVRYAVSLK